MCFHDEHKRRSNYKMQFFLPILKELQDSVFSTNFEGSQFRQIPQKFLPQILDLGTKTGTNSEEIQNRWEWDEAHVNWILNE
jgi:hypothetical protein